jgi:hypothetical protein
MARRECKEYEINQYLKMNKKIPWLHQIANKPRSRKVPHWARGWKSSFWKNIQDFPRSSIRLLNGEVFDPKKVILGDIKSRHGYMYCDVNYRRENNPLVLVLKGWNTKMDGDTITCIPPHNRAGQKLSEILKVQDAIYEQFATTQTPHI